MIVVVMENEVGSGGRRRNDVAAFLQAGAIGWLGKGGAYSRLPTLKLTSQNLRLQFRKSTLKKRCFCQNNIVSPGSSTLIFLDTKRSRVRLRLSVDFPSPLAPSRRKPLLSLPVAKRLTGDEMTGFTIDGDA